MACDTQSGVRRNWVRQHGLNVGLLDEDGQPHAFFKRLDGPPPHGIQYQLGSGTTQYLMMLWYLGIGYVVASFVALPIILSNAGGHRFDNPGIFSLYYAILGSLTQSIGNRRHYERGTLYEVVDVLVSLTVLVSVHVAKREIAPRRPSL